MSSLHPLDGDASRRSDSPDRAQSGLDEHGLEGASIAHFTFDEHRAIQNRSVVPVPGTDRLSTSAVSRRHERRQSYVRGVSVSAVLQMLQLERKTCELGVRSDWREGTLALVEGELVDAGCDGLRGEAAVFRILTWPHPETTIMDGVDRVHRTVNLPLSVLIVESVRRQDESPESSGPDAPDDRLDQARQRNWSRFVESLVGNGALLAAVIRAQDARVLALANRCGQDLSCRHSPMSDDLMTITSEALNWSHLFRLKVEDIVLTFDGRQLLLQPLDADRALFAIALLGAAAQLDPIRDAIRSTAQ